MNGLLTPFSFTLNMGLTIMSKKAPPPIRSSIRTQFYTRIQQSTVSAVAFNDVKNELKNLAHIIFMMMRKSKIQPTHPAA